jgi:hypothetical protein
MSAILTDQFRLLNLQNFINNISANNFYLFVSRNIPWDNENIPPSPIDNYQYYNDIYSNIIALKKLTSADFSPVIKRVNWTSGTVYSMYRPNYTTGNTEYINQSNTNYRYPPTLTSDGYSDLFYGSNFYVMNEFYQVYKCLYNGQSPDNPSGVASIVEPTGNSTTSIKTSDGYIWKYLYTIPTSYILKFLNDYYMPVPYPGTGFPQETAVTSNAIPGAIESVVVKNKGQNYNNISKLVQVDGDWNSNSGTNASVTITTSGGQISSAIVSGKGSKYTFGSITLPIEFGTGTSGSLEVIISPKNGHGYNSFEELGAYKLMINSQISYNQDTQFPIDCSYRQIGLLTNPYNYGSTTISTGNSLVGTSSMTFSSTNNINFVSGENIIQTVGSGTTAYGTVVSWNGQTQVLKYYQDRFNNSSSSNLILFSGTNSVFGITSGAIGNSPNNYTNSSIDKNSGKILFISNEEATYRSPNQTENIKLVIEF